MTATAAPTQNNRAVRMIGLAAIIAGIVLIIAGGLTWGVVRAQLVAENIVLSEDAAMFAGNVVNGPIDAFLQADVISQHALEASGGVPYAELAQDDPVRATVMNASFLRSSLFTSVIAFGVAAFAAGMGLLAILTGVALRLLAPARPAEVVVAPAATTTPLTT